MDAWTKRRRKGGTEDRLGALDACVVQNMTN